MQWSSPKGHNQAHGQAPSLLEHNTIAEGHRVEGRKLLIIGEERRTALGRFAAQPPRQAPPPGPPPTPPPTPPQRPPPPPPRVHRGHNAPQQGRRRSLTGRHFR